VRSIGAGKGKCVPERAVCPFPVGAGLDPCQDLRVDALPRLALERPPVGGLAGRLTVRILMVRHGAAWIAIFLSPKECDAYDFGYKDLEVPGGFRTVALGRNRLFSTQKISRALTIGKIADILVTDRRSSISSFKPRSISSPT